VAVGDGEPPERVQAIAQEHGLSFRLLPDPTSQLARRYRVACWPTAVWIDEHALIERVHFGSTPDLSLPKLHPFDSRAAVNQNMIAE